MVLTRLVPLTQARLHFLLHAVHILLVVIVKTGGKVRVLVKVVIFLQLLLDYVLLVISIVDDAVWKNYDPTASQWRLLLVPLGSHLRPYVHIKLLLIKFHLISWAHYRCSLAHDMIPNRQIPPNRDLIRE